MKFVLLFATSYLGVISAGVTENSGPSNFYDSFYSVIRGNSKYYQSLDAGIAEINLDLHQSKLRNFMANITVNSNAARDEFAKLSKNILGTHAYDQRSRDSFKSSPFLSSGNLEIQKRIASLKKMIGYSLNEASTTISEIGVLQNITIDNFDKLETVLDDLQAEASDKDHKWLKRVNEKGVEKDVEVYKDPYVKKMISGSKFDLRRERINQFLDDAELYEPWIENLPVELLEILVVEEFLTLVEEFSKDREKLVNESDEKKKFPEKRRDKLRKCFINRLKGFKRAVPWSKSEGSKY